MIKSIEWLTTKSQHKKASYNITYLFISVMNLLDANYFNRSKILQVQGVYLTLSIGKLICHRNCLPQETG